MDKITILKIKGIALIMMFWHHLFGCQTWLTNNHSYEYISLFPNFVLTTAISGKMCLGLFAICSGYGLYKSYICRNKISSNNNFIRIIKFLIKYWVILFLIAIPYLFVTKRLEIKYLFVNLFSLFHNDDILYVSLSWYIKVNLGFLLILPFYRKINLKSWNIYFDTFIFIIVPAIIRILTKEYNCESSYFIISENIIKFILSSVNVVSYYLPYFGIGILISKYEIDVKISKLINNIMKSYIYILITLFIINILYNVFSSFYLIVYVSTTILFILLEIILDKRLITKKMDKVFEIIGNYSYELWLISGMFYLNTSELAYILYLPKYCLLILIWNVIVCLPLSYLCSRISNFIICKIFRL